MTYVVSDLHGCFEKFKKLLKEIHFTDNDVLYVVGDIVDYGEESMELLCDLSMRFNVIPILGDHDYRAYRMLTELDKMLRGGAPEPEVLGEMTEWIRDGGQKTMEAFTAQFDHEYHRYVSQVGTLVKQAVSLSADPAVSPVEAMEKLQCRTGAQVLAGMVYALLSGGEDFDTSLIISVNHSGASAAVGALVGAILGARLGVDALPEFYLECLECRDVLQELADDLYQGCPIETGDTFFDDEWDGKYCHGKR